jgi:predicted DNA binding CopG/RHH family protein
MCYIMSVKKKASQQDNSDDIFQLVKQKKKPKTTAITFRIPSDLAERFRSICSREGVSQTEIVVEILKRAIQSKGE